MSDEVYTHPVGVSFGDIKRPVFNTKVQRSVSGNESRAGFRLYPLWEFSFAYEVLRQTESHTERDYILGFFLERRGMLDSFLYLDQKDYLAEEANFGTGDGTTATFQLSRTLGGFKEPVHNVKTLTNIKVNGSVVNPADYSVSSTGLVTFNSAPTDTHEITWNGEYYYRCRFTQDETDFEQFMKDFWELGTLEFVGSPMNKVKG